MITPQRSLCLCALLTLLLAGGGCTRAARAQRDLAKANADFAALHYENAELEYRACLRLSRLNASAIRGLGLIYFEDGRYREAYIYLKKANELMPNDLRIENGLAGVYLLFNDPQKSSEMARKVLQSSSTNMDALITLADTVRKPADVAPLQRYIVNLSRTGPDCAGFHIVLASLELREQKLADAEKELRTAVALDPKSSQGYFYLAALDIMRKDPQHATMNFERAANLAPVRSNVRIKYANYLLQMRRPDDAKKFLEDITHQAPDFITPSLDLMRLAFSQQRFDDCLRITQSILSRDPSNVEAMLQRGLVPMAKGDGPKAVTELQQIETVEKNNVEVKYRLAQAYLMTGSQSKATASLEAGLALNPNYGPAILTLSELNIRGGNALAAVNRLKQFLKNQPQNVQAHLMLATAYLAQRKPEDALAVYRTLMQSFPRDPQVPLLMGEVYFEMNDPVRARSSFDRALSVAPDYLPALEQLVGLDLAEKRYSGAMALINQQIQLHPKSAQPLLLQAQVYRLEGQTNEAETVLAKAINLDPSRPQPYLMLARLYIDSNKDKEALERLNALVSKTNDVSALMEIGLIHDQLKQFDQAAAAYEKLLSVSPNFTAALNNLAYLDSEHLDHLDRAYDLAEKAHNSRPFDPYTEDTLGWILYKQGQYPRALALLQDSAEKQENDPEVQMHLGMAYYMMDEQDVARVSLQRALTGATDFPHKEEGRKALAILKIDPQTASPATIATLEKAIKDDSSDPVALDIMSGIQERMGKPEEAAANYENVIKRNPQNWEALTKLADLYYSRLNDPAKALELAKAAHTLAPDNPRVSLVLGRAAFRTGDYPWSQSLLEEAVRQLPGDPSVLYDAAWAYYSVGRVADADAMMRNALASTGNWPHRQDAQRFVEMREAAASPVAAQAAAASIKGTLQANASFVPALMANARLQEKQSDYSTAAETYQKVLSIYPLFSPAGRELAILYTEHLHDDAKAMEYAETATVAFPSDGQLLRDAGLLDYRQAQFSRSAQLLRQSIQNGYADAEVFYYLGVDYYKLKQRGDSRDALRRALAMNLPSSLAGDAKRFLGDLK